MIDTPYSIAGVCKAIKAAGHGAVIRYLSPNAHRFSDKLLTADEVLEAGEVGIWLLGVWGEAGAIGTDAYDKGRSHACQAIEVYRGLGAPEGAGIGFSIETDAGVDELAGVVDYFRGAHEIAQSDGSYQVYVYGSDPVNQAVYDAGFARYRWLAGAYDWGDMAGWKAKDDPTRWEILQLPETAKIAGLDVDLDYYTRDLRSIGFWKPV